MIRGEQNKDRMAMVTWESDSPLDADNLVPVADVNVVVGEDDGEDGGDADSEMAEWRRQLSWMCVWLDTGGGLASFSILDWINLGVDFFECIWSNEVPYSGVQS